MKKIFIVTGEPSGDKLASRVISNLKKKTSEIEYLCLGGSHLKSLGIKSIFDLSEITYFAFTNVYLTYLKLIKKLIIPLVKLLNLILIFCLQLIVQILLYV